MKIAALALSIAVFTAGGALPATGAAAPGPSSRPDSSLLTGVAAAAPDPVTFLFIGGGLVSVFAFRRRQR